MCVGFGNLSCNSPNVFPSGTWLLFSALFRAIARDPKDHITTIAAGQSRPLFTLADFQRFRGQRAQLTFRNAVAGRCNLVGELLGAEAGHGDDSEPFAIILDETKGDRLHAPLSQLQLGEDTALVRQSLHTLSSQPLNCWGKAASPFSYEQQVLPLVKRSRRLRHALPVHVLQAASP